MKNHLKIVIISLLFLVANKLVYCQNDTVLIKSHPNVIHGNIGFLEANLNYEHRIYDLNKSYINLRFGYGLWSGWAGSGDNIYLSGQYLHGRKKSHLELAFGLKIQIDDCCDGSWLTDLDNIYSIEYVPLINLGYRHEKPGKGLIFRTGLGTESFIYIGLGYKF